ncbi:hypothetical protein J2S25_003200 [Mesobacillus stamsii]|uniref:Uncharacterized protein n=1 Tax=Mesobacillus stamsii TaxID=225347 RepID=A0ABU0FYJ3_9BACI|nr:hypothetical protein [Mesobacillus stamsii]
MRHSFGKFDQPEFMRKAILEHITNIFVLMIGILFGAFL